MENDLVSKYILMTRF